MNCSTYDNLTFDQALSLHVGYAHFYFRMHNFSSNPKMSRGGGGGFNPPPPGYAPVRLDLSLRFMDPVYMKRTIVILS